MILVDTHAHLEMIEDLDSAIKRAQDAGVKAIVANGINPETNRKALEYAEKYDIVQAALGLYPEEVETLSDKDIDEEIDFITKNKEKIVAIGEVGLDKKKKDDIDKQKKVFSQCIKLSEKLKKPLSIHSRKAEHDVLEMLESSTAKIHLHCFSGKLKLVKKAADLGYYFSIPTSCVRSEHFQKIIADVDINQLLTETDAPFLSPFKDKKNEPSFVIESVKKIAEIKEMDVEEVANNVWMNYKRIF